MFGMFAVWLFRVWFALVVVCLRCCLFSSCFDACLRVTCAAVVCVG